MPINLFLIKSFPMGKYACTNPTARKKIGTWHDSGILWEYTAGNRYVVCASIINNIPTALV